MKKKIMIVDDEPDIIFAVKIDLEELFPDFEIMSTGSGKECLDLLEKNKNPELILLDIMMPDMNGWELYDKIKNNSSWRNIPIVFLTARTDKIAKNNGEFLAEDFIEKPYEQEDFKKRLNKILNRK